MILLLEIMMNLIYKTIGHDWYIVRSWLSTCSIIRAATMYYRMKLIFVDYVQKFVVGQALIYEQFRYYLLARRYLTVSAATSIATKAKTKTKNEAFFFLK